jgi:hypothetical protein
VTPLERAISARMQAQQQAASKRPDNAAFRAHLADTLRICWGGPRPAATPPAGGAGNVADGR